MRIPRREQMEFIDYTLNYVSALTGSDQLAFYQVDEARNPCQFVLKNVDQRFHQTYVEKMYDLDPLSVERLSPAIACGRVFVLDSEEQSCSAELRLAYRSFLSDFSVSNVMEMLFMYGDEVFAGVSALLPQDRVLEVSFPALHAACDYIEFNLQRFARNSERHRATHLNYRYGLSPREVEVAELLCAGKTNAEIAALLAIGIPTVKTHLIRIFQKLGVESRAGAVGLLAGR